MLLLTATKVPFAFLYFATTTDDFVIFLANSATGSAYPAVSAKTFEDAVLLVSPAPLLKKFGQATIPIAEQIHALRCQTKNLRCTRDLLLPRLLSGQISVLLGIATADRSLKLTSDTFLALPYGIGIKQGNTALKRWVDSRLELMRKKDMFNAILKNNVPARAFSTFQKNILRPDNTFTYSQGDLTTQCP